MVWAKAVFGCFMYVLTFGKLIHQELLGVVHLVTNQTVGARAGNCLSQRFTSNMLWSRDDLRGSSITNRIMADAGLLISTELTKLLGESTSHGERESVIGLQWDGPRGNIPPSALGFERAFNYHMRLRNN